MVRSIARTTTFASLATIVGACGSGPTPAGHPFEPRSGASVVVAAAGDISCPGAPCSGQRRTAELVSRIDPDVVLVLGDVQYKEAALAEFVASYEPTWGRFKAITRPVPGNHEYRSAGADGYFDYFGPVAHEDRGGWYSVEIEDWHVLAINSGTGIITDEQLAWVRSDLASDVHVCELAFWHHPRWTSGTEHGSAPEPDLAPLWRALHTAGVDVVVNGHQHNYERFAPLDPHGRLDPAGGIRQFVAGTGGRSLFGLGRPAFGSQRRIDQVFGVLELTLAPGAYRWRFVSVSERTLDGGRGRCHA